MYFIFLYFVKYVRPGCQVDPKIFSSLCWVT